jgi:hypothetical protein
MTHPLYHHGKGERIASQDKALYQLAIASPAIARPW